MTKAIQIAQLGNEVLRLQARPIDDIGEVKFQTLIDTLLALMLEHNGVGIAAPQIGESWQIVIVASRPTPRYPAAPTMEPVVMINPHFEVTDASLHKDWEGCLSIPGIRALVPRYRAVRVSFRDRQGEARQLDLSDFPARIFQHEYDHLIGKVYLDRVEDTTDIIAESEFYKRVAA